LVKRARRKIPRNAVEMLMDACEMLSEEWEKPAAEIFKGFLKLMDRYGDYFFSKPWPEKYDYEEATTFTDEDMDFLLESKGEFSDRYTTVCLKKNMNLEIGFMGIFGMFWTQQAFDEKFVRPGYKPVLEAFDGLAKKNEDAQRALSKLKERFCVQLIHDSLVDLIEHEYPEESTRKLIKEILELLHAVDGLASCKNARCSWYRSQEYPESNGSG
jgi:hypothetical protein